MILPTASSPGWPLAVAAALAYLVPVFMGRQVSGRAQRLAMTPGWLLHALALAAGVLGSTPHFGFAPALSMTLWLVLATYAVEHQVLPQMQSRGAVVGMAILAALVVLAAAVFPGLALQERSSPWLALHLTLGIASYGLIAAAVVHAWLMGRAEQRIRQAEQVPGRLPLLALERLTFRFITAGFILLSATLAEGWLFGEQLYGHAPRWDHKNVFSLLAWLTIAVLLVGRARFGWRGRKARRVLYAGAALLLLAYVGSRFVLEVVLGRSA
ncbi:inner membrane protein YpjD [Comamonas sp. NLF-1-9]|uniref:cytochrome C assembly family protein n=1 Tax=Comamonas sp. NLF-1-9 TaxID=2853163 RepID=UPI001C4888D1|nr:cytochrome c biogenesis protein CcsA [Comamonas sp. NLF-1-9]QXL83369.1 cytochrome c biogenesis protein CcsA [Comamonas sp. NLF-1-9]